MLSRTLTLIHRRSFASGGADKFSRVGTSSASMAGIPVKREVAIKADSTEQTIISNQPHPNESNPPSTIYTQEQVARGLGNDNRSGRVAGKSDVGESQIGEGNYGSIERNYGKNEGYKLDIKNIFGPDSDQNWFGMFNGELKKKGGGGFGHVWDQEPQWIHRWEHDLRVGKDRLDWFFRGFNRLRIYEIFLKNQINYLCTLVCISIFGGFAWDRFWERVWLWNNAGKLYHEHPYVYPPEDD